MGVIPCLSLSFVYAQAGIEQRKNPDRVFAKKIKYKNFSHNYLKIVLFFSAKVNSFTTIIVTFLATMKIEQKRLYENL